MRISLLGPTHPFRGGIAHHTTLLFRALARDHEVQFLSFKRQYPAFLYPGRDDRDPSQAPVRVGGVEFILDPVDPRTWPGTVAAIVDFAPHILVLPWWVTFWAAPFAYVLRSVRRRARARSVVICHNAEEHESNQVKRWLTRAVLGQADRLVTHSRTDTVALRRLVGGNPEIVTGFHPSYGDLPLKRFERGAAREQLGLSGGVLLFFGFIREYKGLHILLEALPAVLERHPVTLLVVGEFWREKDRYVRQIERLGLGASVRIVDAYVPNEEVGLYFAAADLVVQPYLSATGSGIVQLAYGFDRPVVATRVGALPEVIEDGATGRIVPAGDPAPLARAIVETLEPATLKRYSSNAAATKLAFPWTRYVSLVVGAGTEHNQGGPLGDE